MAESKAMYLLETLKKTFETMTGAGRPSHTSLEASVAPRTPHTTMFRDDGVIPNNPELPFVHYLGAVALPERGDPAAVFEELFERNGWGNSWRNGIYDYVIITPARTKCSALRAGTRACASAATAARLWIYGRETSSFFRPERVIKALTQARTCWSSALIRRMANTTNAGARGKNTSAHSRAFRKYLCRRRTRYTVPMALSSTPGTAESFLSAHPQQHGAHPHQQNRSCGSECGGAAGKTAHQLIVIG